MQPKITSVAYTANTEIVKTYSLDFFGKLARKKFEAANPDLKVLRVEELKEWDTGRACCLALIFLPLLFFGKTKRVKITYQYAGDNK